MAMADPKDIRRARRIMILSRSNGMSGLSLGILAVIVSLSVGDVLSLLASLGLCAAATIELFGSARARRHDASAPRFLAASQAVSIVSVLALLIRMMVAIDGATVLRWMPATWSETTQILYPGPGEAEAMVAVAARFTLALAALAVVLFEAGVAAYYASSAGTFARLAATRSRGE